MGFTLLLLSSTDGWSLPPCPGSYNASTWHNCIGTYTSADGDKYVGEYRDGKKNGQGTYTFANGRKYVGEFKNGFSHGKGIQYYADGTVEKEGIWKDDAAFQ